MLDRIWGSLFHAERSDEAKEPRRPRRSRSDLSLENLETRGLLTASLGALGAVTVPSQIGMSIWLDGSGATGTNQQQFTVTSDNPDITASIAKGPFFSVEVTHDGTSTPGDISFTGTMVMQLFSDLTPNTVKQIRTYVNDGYYVGKDFTRILNGFPGVNDWIAQGGAPNPDGSGNSGQPGTPFANEIVQQLAFTNPQQIAMANAGGTNTNDTQFFLTTGVPTSLDYNYTVFGQMVGGANILNDMTQVKLTTNPLNPKETSFPVNPITIQSASLSDTNVSGVLLLDTTQAKVGEVAHIVVKAIDPKSNSTVTRTFTVTVGSYTGPANPAINFRPFANAFTQNVIGSSTTVQLRGQSGNPTTSGTESLSYTLTAPPTHGTVSNFNKNTGTFTYTPDANYIGPDQLSYTVTSTNSAKTPVTTSNAATVNLNVVTTADTGTVRQIGPVLIVTPRPHKNPHFTNTIVVSQTTGSSPTIQVMVNGVIDTLRPLASSLNQIVVYGSKANDKITIDPSVTVPATIDGGHGGRNKLVAGSYNVREHGWFGTNTLVGGTGRNQLVGRAGQVRFKATKTSSLIFAGVPHSRNVRNLPTPPGGTFYRYVKGHLIPVSSRP